MSISDLFDLSNAVLSAGLAIKNEKTLEKEDPESFQSHIALKAACSNSAPGSSLVGGPEGTLVFNLQNINRDIFRTEFNAHATVIPGENITMFWYQPEGAIFVVGNPQSRMLINWVNARLPIGNFYVHKSFTNNVGREVEQLAFTIAIDNKFLPVAHREKVYANCVDDLMSYLESFQPIIKAVGMQTISFNENQLIGEKADQIILRYEQALARRSASIQPGRREVLEGRIAKLLPEFREDIKPTYTESNKVFTLQILSDLYQNFPLFLQVNPLCQIMVQSCSPFLTDEQMTIIQEEDLLEFAANSTFGNYHLNRLGKRVVYTNGLDARGLEDEILVPAIDFMLSDHMRMPHQVLINFPTLADEKLSQLTAVYGDEEDDEEDDLDEEDEVADMSSGYTAQPSHLNPTLESNRMAYAPPVPTEPVPYTHATPSQSVSPKNRNTALVLEILPGLFGILGLGWFYSGNKARGLLIFFGMLAWDAISIITLAFTAGLGLFCVGPIYLGLIALSAYMLNRYTKTLPNLFGQ